MLDLCPLQSLYVDRIDETSSLLDQAVCQLLLKQEPPSHDIGDLCRWEEPFLSEEKGIENWRCLLTLNVLYDLSSLPSSDLAAKIRQFERHPWNRSSQFFRSLVALNHALAKMPVPEVGPHLLESGAALIDLHEYCPWLALPYTPQHFEFGIYLCMLALITKKNDLQENVLRIASWQMNTLDVNGSPLPGVFVRENEGYTLRHLCLSYLLFRAAALLSNDKPFGAIAQAILEMIPSVAEKKNEKFDPLWVLVEHWLNKHPVETRQPLDLPEHIHDPSTALVGFRSEKQHVLCTLHGEHTGLGALRYGDVEIVNFGPQYLPLGECGGFGIEGNALSDQGVRRSQVEWRRNTFILRGCTRLVDQPAAASGGLGLFRGIWLEVSQEFKRPHFYLKTSFLGLDGWDSVAMSFFVKASRCKLASQTLSPRTLDRYEGDGQTVLIEGNEGVLELRPLSFEGKMHVIPLAGGECFWGADFLIAYLMSPEQRHYQWHIGPPR